jgi:hypothetical protein
MLVLVFLLVTLLAAIGAYLMLTDRMPDVVGPLLCIGLGSLQAYGALALEFTNGSQVNSSPEPALAFVGLAILVLSLVVLFDDAIGTLSLGTMRGSR